MGKTAINAGLATGITGAMTIFLYLTISLPLFMHTAPIALYRWDASNILGIRAASHDAIPAIVLVGQGAHVIVSLVWGFVFVLLARRFPGLLQRPIVSGFIYGAFVMLFMHYLVVPLGHAPQNSYTLLGFTNTFVAHTLFFGVPVALVASRLVPSPGSLKPGY
jgi:hypothetical protein